jgi:hypothetical protein
MHSTVVTRFRGGNWLPELSLPSLILLLIAGHTIYYISKRYLEYRVGEGQHVMIDINTDGDRPIWLLAPVMAASLHRNYLIDGLWASIV